MPGPHTINKYIPPLNFSPVISTEVSLYRSGYPMAINYSFIVDQLHLKTVVYIGDKADLLPEYASFLEREQITFVHIPMDSCRDEGINERIDEVLRMIVNVDNYPMLLHSNKGKHRVGIVVGIVRKILQGWSIASIYQEYGLFSGGMKDETDLEFITMFVSHLETYKDKLPKFVRM
ncbi:Oca2 protein [Maudiozyma humilis]|uniref:Oca2 protein n=1 Tax=Maudiozyma humilis TaxID=51915 RepID=A0AAV5RT20_MAUHU|nr:Oca2 protein [Kazachstania humilis]